MRRLSACLAALLMSAPAFAGELRFSYNGPCMSDYTENRLLVSDEKVVAENGFGCLKVDNFHKAAKDRIEADLSDCYWGDLDVRVEDMKMTLRAYGDERWTITIGDRMRGVFVWMCQADL